MLEELNSKKSRNYGIDALRVLSAIMIVMLHVLSQGGVLSAFEDLTFKGEFMWWIQCSCLSFVNVFALISGYVCVGGKHKISNVLNLWLQVFLYTLVSKIIVLIFFERSFSILAFFKSFFPVSTSENWYFTAYFVLFMLIPILNEIMEKIDSTIIKKTLLVSIFLFMIVESISSVQVFGVRAGYSVIWLVLMYVIGAYLKKYDPLKQLAPWHCIVGFFSCMTLSLLSKILIELVTLSYYGAPAYGTKFLIYTSPVMVMQAVFMFQLFSKLRMPKSIQKLVSWFAPMTFGVFILHTTTAVYRYMLHDAFSFVREYTLIATIGISIAATLVIWLACSAIDYIRICLFKLLRINNLTVWFGVKIENILSRLCD